MLLHFYKYQGTGNDFVIIDDRRQTFPVSQELVARLCDRRFGIGADGLMLLQNHPDYDFKMVYFNSDGNTSSMCGNGGRCLVRFAHALGIFQQETTFDAVDGKHEAYVQNGLIYLKMNDVRYVQRETEFDFLNTGSPHYVTFQKNVQGMTHEEVVMQGRAVRYNDYFAPKGGTNVNFVEVMPDNSLFVRTYERGVEDETYSCGTGVTACALAANFRQFASPVQIHTKGGDLQVSFRQVGEHEFTDIYLIGPAEKVFEGMIEI
jgi:diaminopimelate epimerase